MLDVQKLSWWIVVPVALVFWGIATLWEKVTAVFEAQRPVSVEEVDSISPTIDIGPRLTEVSLADEIFVCRAAIAEMMGHDLGIVTGVRRADGNVGVSYRRPSDNSLWNNLCKLDGNRVVWASMNEAGIAGRWRTNKEDEVVTFVLGRAGVTINQEFGDGSTISDSFGRE